MRNVNRETKLGVSMGHVVFKTQDRDSGTKLSIRRVKPQSEAEHVQIEVEITRIGEKRTNSYHGYVELPVDMVAPFVAALSKVQPPHDSSKAYKSISDSDKEWADFYGIDKPERIY